MSHIILLTQFLTSYSSLIHVDNADAYRTLLQRQNQLPVIYKYEHILILSIKSVKMSLADTVERLRMEYSAQIEYTFDSRARGRKLKCSFCNRQRIHEPFPQLKVILSQLELLLMENFYRFASSLCPQKLFDFTRERSP